MHITVKRTWTVVVVSPIVIRLYILSSSHLLVQCAMTEPIESPKSKDKVTWKGRMVRHFRRHGSAPSAHGYVAAKMGEVTGTFGVPLELCVSSTFSPVRVLVVYTLYILVDDVSIHFLLVVHIMQYFIGSIISGNIVLYCTNDA